MYDIKILRGRTGKTQLEFSKWLHIPLKTLQKWEQSVSSPPDWVLELIEYKIFMTYMVDSSPVRSAPESDVDLQSLFSLIETELDCEPSESKYCIYRPDHGGCSHCLKPDNEDCNIRCWSRYKDFFPD